MTLCGINILELPEASIFGSQPAKFQECRAGRSTAAPTSSHRFLACFVQGNRANCLVVMGIPLEHFFDCLADRLFDGLGVFHWVSARAVLQRLTRASAPNGAPRAGISDVDYQHSF